MLTVEELRTRAKKEPLAVLRVWLHDSRRWVRKVASVEIAARGPQAGGERG